MAGRVEKFAALRLFLEEKARRFQTSGESVLAMSFAEIEALGVRLPPSAYRHRAWWSNGNIGRPWDGLFKPADVNLQTKMLQFRYAGDASPEMKLRTLAASTSTRGKPAIANVASPLEAERKNPGPAAPTMRGFLRIVAGTDLTEPGMAYRSRKRRP